MKNSLKLTALLLLASASIFAATPTKTVVPFTADIITFSSLPSLTGLDIKVDKNVAGKVVVLVYDQNNNVVFKDVMSGAKSMEKGYILNQLQNGDYTLEVSSGKQTIKKEIHVYDEDNVKTFFVVQK
jgi:hypothetical protein